MISGLATPSVMSSARSAVLCSRTALVGPFSPSIHSRNIRTMFLRRAWNTHLLDRQAGRSAWAYLACGVCGSHARGLRQGRGTVSNRSFSSVAVAITGALIFFGLPDPDPVVGGNIVDSSCGSGLVSRLFAKSGLFSLVAKISRVLRLGRVFVATTYILDGPFGFVPFLRPLRQQTRHISDSSIFLSELELEDLCKAYGRVGFTCIRNGAFVMISATKPT
ncbi:hypothetical protein UlMin_007526 [Ulmus minor]